MTEESKRTWELVLSLSEAEEVCATGSMNVLVPETFERASEENYEKKKTRK